MKTRILSPIVALLALTSLTQAATVIYTTQASFLAAVSGLTSTETFDSLPPISLSPITFTPAGFSVDAISTGGFTNFTKPGPDVWLSSGRLGSPVTFNITSGSPLAVGGFFFSTDADGLANGASVTVVTNDGTTQSTPVTNSGTFVGFVSDAPITSLVVSASNQGFNFPTANNLTVAAVPEPSSLGLIAVAAAAGVMTRRRKASGV